MTGFLTRFADDFWPPDRSFVGPNLLASVLQAIAVVVVAGLLYPPMRAFVRYELDRLHDKLDGHHAALKQQAADHHAEHMAEIHNLRGAQVADEYAKDRP